MELFTIIVASVSCGAFCLVMLTLFMVLHRNDICCSYTQRSDDYWDETIQYSVQSLISQVSSNYPFIHGAPGTQHSPRGVFVVGKPSHYQLCGPAPRLPSYDTVRRADRRRHAHSLITQRLGLGPNAEPPPSYEESVRLSLDISAVDVCPTHTATTTETHQTQLNRDNHAALE